MSTRGFITFAVDGQLKTAYNHSDSYPDYLGVRILGWLRESNHAAARKQAKELRVVSETDKPTPEDIERLGKFANTNVSTQKIDEWYVLLRETQGDPAAMLEAGVIEDGSEFPADSLFAEWGYVVDFDGDGQFEVYEGFQHAAHDRGRFASLTPGSDGYAPVALKASWPLAALPSDEDFLKAVEDKDDE